MKNKIVYIVISLMLVLWTGCKEEGRIDHIDYSAPAPAQVTEVDIRNTPGGAVLKYKLPKDDNLLYVRAEYEIKPGVILETRTSYYADSLILEGFGDTRTYDVKLYSVGRNEKTSEPLRIKVNPLTPPVLLAVKKLEENFGGVSIRIENPEKANLAIILMGDVVQEDNFQQTYMHTFYTSAEKGKFTYRGLDTVPGNFSVYLRDRWDNRSDTIGAALTPWPEEEISKKTWEEYHLPTDSWQPLQGNMTYRLSKAWDGIVGPSTNSFISAQESPMPQWQTWDLGVTIVMSRLRLWHNSGGGGNYEYAYGNQKEFELWGSVDPDPDGSWDSWTPLGQFEVVKPSGQTPPTADDYAFARAGFDFDLEETEFARNPFVPVRYIRFKTNKVWYGDVTSWYIYLGEISFWGMIL